MRGLMLTISFVAMAGAAFAAEPQKQVTMHTPLKLTDQQLEKVVAGSATPTPGLGRLTAASVANSHSNIPAAPPGQGVCQTGKSGRCI